jgi:hypothetical protein
MFKIDDQNLPSLIARFLLIPLFQILCGIIIYSQFGSFIWSAFLSKYLIIYFIDILCLFGLKEWMIDNFQHTPIESITHWKNAFKGRWILLLLGFTVLFLTQSDFHIILIMTWWMLAKFIGSSFYSVLQTKNGVKHVLLLEVLSTIGFILLIISQTYISLFDLLLFASLIETIKCIITIFLNKKIIDPSLFIPIINLTWIKSSFNYFIYSITKTQPIYFSLLVSSVILSSNELCKSYFNLYTLFIFSILLSIISILLSKYLIQWSNVFFSKLIVYSTNFIGAICISYVMFQYFNIFNLTTLDFIVALLILIFFVWNENLMQNENANPTTFNNFNLILILILIVTTPLFYNLYGFTGLLLSLVCCEVVKFIFYSLRKVLSK